jgi:hypothetical protein
MVALRVIWLSIHVDRILVAKKTPRKNKRTDNVLNWW